MIIRVNECSISNVELVFRGGVYGHVEFFSSFDHFEVAKSKYCSILCLVVDCVFVSSVYVQMKKDMSFDGSLLMVDLFQ